MFGSCDHDRIDELEYYRVAPTPHGWRRYWPLIRWAAGLALVGLAIWLVAGESGELAGAGRDLAHLRWWWLALAVVAEAASYIAFATLQRILLGCGDVPAGTGRLVGISAASNSLQNSLPAGAAFAAAFVYRQFRRLGADEVLAGWTVLAQVALSFLAITAMALTGLVLAFGTGNALDLAQVIVGIALVGVAVVGGWFARGWLLDRAVLAVRLVKRLTGHPRGDPDVVVDEARQRLGAIAPDRSAWVEAGVFAFGNWTLDLGCLTLGFLAVGAGVPWRGLLLAYAAAQLAATLPITPGGLGVVEGSLTIALVAFGGAEASAVAAVLVYRLISFWAELPIGWAAWAVVTRRRCPRERRLALATLGEGGIV